MVAAAVVGSAVVGAAVSSSAAKSAAGTQASAARDAAGIQNAQWQQTQENLSPYLQLGNTSINPLMRAMGYNPDGSVNGGNILQQQFSAPTAQQAQDTPGYQFTQQQGLKAVQSSASARGLGTSGAAMKGAAQYATGLADSTYNDVYARALQTFNTNYSSAANNANRLQGLVSNGQNAASTNGSLGAATAGAIGNTLTSAANASAAGTVGAANAVSSAAGSLGNSALVYGLTQNNAAKNTGNTQQYGNLNPSSSDPI